MQKNIVLTALVYLIFLCPLQSKAQSNDALGSSLQNQSVVSSSGIPPKLLEAIDQLEEEATYAYPNIFVGRDGQSLPSGAKNEFLALIKNQKNRFNVNPVGVYILISSALQDGFLLAPCKKNGELDLECSDPSAAMMMRRNHEKSYFLAEEASNLNITYFPLAKHYISGRFIKRSLFKAYENFKKEGLLRHPALMDELVVKMLQSELKQYESKVNISGQIDASTCIAFKKITASNDCGQQYLNSMLGSLEIDKVTASSVRVSIGDLKGDWISESPLYFGSIPIKGFQVVGEGVMYTSTDSNGARNYASSFDIELLDKFLQFKITFSAAGIPVGTKLVFEVWKTKNGSLIFSSQDSFAIYKKN